MKSRFYPLIRLGWPVFLGLILCSMTFPRAEAGGASLKDIVVTNTRDHLSVYFCGSGFFTGDMVKAIDSGIHTTFSFYIQLYEVRNLWWDRRVATLKVNHDISYDSLKKIYTVSIPESEQRIVTLDDFDQAKRLMSSVVGLKVTELSILEKGKRYQIRMMAELGKIRLPFYLHHVLFFLSLWDFKTDWYTFDFRY